MRKTEDNVESRRAPSRVGRGGKYGRLFSSATP